MSEDTICDKTIKDYFSDINQVTVLAVSMEKVQPVNVLSKLADKYLNTDEVAPIIKFEKGKKIIEPTQCKLLSPSIKNYFNFNLGL